MRRSASVNEAPAFRALINSLGDGRRFYEEWRLRWDRPIQATIELAGPLNGLPRFPFQLAIAGRRLPKLVRTMSAMATERWQHRFAGVNRSREGNTG